MRLPAPASLLLLLSLFCSVPQAGGDPVLIGFDSERGLKRSTSDDAIKLGIQIALDEINRAGGVLGGRPLQLVERENRSVPARGVENIKLFAADPRVVAIFCGRFSPVVLQELETIHRLGIPLLDPWAAADRITHHEFQPSYTFRLSLRDSWATPVMMAQARSQGARRIGVLLPNTGWGRSNNRAVDRFMQANPEMTLSKKLWYNWGDQTLLDKYLEILEAGAEALMYVGNDREGQILVQEIARLPAAQRLPIVSHWGVTGGDFAQVTAGALDRLDFSVVQTYSFIGATRPQSSKVIKEVLSRTGESDIGRVLSPVGIAHAYDLTHILARAVDLAGNTDRAQVRDALEQVRDYSGLIKDYARPFDATRHDALKAEDVFMARYRPDGGLERIR